MNDATAQFGMQLGHSAVAAGQEYVQRNFGTIFPSTTLKHHFNVSNTYVINKLRIVLFPWLHKPWGRRIQRSEQGQAPEWQSPRDDINSPDLYIPLMAIVTYILLYALHTGFQGQFHPKVHSIRIASFHLLDPFLRSSENPHPVPSSLFFWILCLSS